MTIVRYRKPFNTHLIPAVDNLFKVLIVEPGNEGRIFSVTVDPAATAPHEISKDKVNAWPFYFREDDTLSYDPSLCEPSDFHFRQVGQSSTSKSIINGKINIDTLGTITLDKTAQMQVTDYELGFYCQNQWNYVDFQIHVIDPNNYLRCSDILTVDPNKPLQVVTYQSVDKLKLTQAEILRDVTPCDPEKIEIEILDFYTIAD